MSEPVNADTTDEAAACRCTEELAEAACPDHGVLAFLRAAWAAEFGDDDEGRQIAEQEVP